MSPSDPNFRPPPPSFLSHHEEPFPAELARKEEQKPRKWFPRIGIVLLIIVGTLVGAAVYFAAPGEITKWRMAAAEEKRLNGDLSGAIADLSRALEGRPNDQQLLRRRAELYIDAGDYEAALADWNRVVELYPEDISSHWNRSVVYQYLGMHDEALADWQRLKESDAFSYREGRAMILNGYAYARALANREIDEALKDIDEALRRAGGMRHEMLDTRGFLYYRQGDYERALDDLNRAVRVAVEEYENTVASRDGFGRPDPRQQELLIRQQAKTLAVILYHRALAYEGEGNSEAAEKDFARVRELGFEPNEQLF